MIYNPVGGGGPGSQNLSQVLAVGNDANGQDIKGLDTLTSLANFNENYQTKLVNYFFSWNNSDFYSRWLSFSYQTSDTHYVTTQKEVNWFDSSFTLEFNMMSGQSGGGVIMGNNDGDNGVGIRMTNNGPFTSSISVYFGQTLVLSATTTVTDNHIHSIRVCYDGTTLTILIDGNVDASIVVAPPTHSTAAFRMGDVYALISAVRWAGLLNHVRISDTVRDSASAYIPCWQWALDSHTLAYYTLQENAPLGNISTGISYDVSLNSPNLLWVYDYNDLTSINFADDYYYEDPGFAPTGQDGSRSAIITVPNSADFYPQTDWTIEFAIGDGGRSESIGNYATGEGWYWQRAYNSVDCTFHAEFVSGGVDLHYTQTGSYKCRFIRVTYNGTTLKLYVDGMLTDSAAVNSTLVVGSNSLMFGSIGDGVYDAGDYGTYEIHDFRISNILRCTGDYLPTLMPLIEHRFLPFTLDANTLVYYKFSEITPIGATNPIYNYDSSGRGHTGTLSWNTVEITFRTGRLLASEYHVTSVNNLIRGYGDGSESEPRNIDAGDYATSEMDIYGNVIKLKKYTTPGHLQVDSSGTVSSDTAVYLPDAPSDGLTYSRINGTWNGGSFSYEVVPSGTTVTVPLYQQMIVSQNVDIVGELVLLGNLVTIN